MEHSAWVTILQACVPILVALVGIVPTIVSNRKETQKSIEALQKTLNDHIKEDENQNAKTKRYRILRFYDELCEGKVHSESHFEDIIEDIDEYEAYCEKHKDDFKNNRGQDAMKYIKEVFNKLKTSGKFLMHKEEE